MVTTSEEPACLAIQWIFGGENPVQNIRAVPEIILGGGPHIFFQAPPPPGHTWGQSPPNPQDT